MILFFIASTLFNDIKDLNKKKFNTQVKKSEEVIKEEKVSTPKFKLLDKTY